MWRKEEKKKNPTSTDGKNGGGANVEKAFGVWCDNTKHWIPHILLNYQITM